MVNRLVLPEGVREWMQANINPDALPEADRERDLAFLRGEHGLTMNQILELAKRTRIPSGYFFLSSPPNEVSPLLEYRTMDSMGIADPSRNLIDIVHRMENIQDWIREELLANDIEPMDISGCISMEDGIAEGAKKVRSLLELSENWYSKSKKLKKNLNLVRSRMEDCGVTVMFGTRINHSPNRILDTREFRAFAMADNLAPLIFVNENDTLGAQLFSLLHEFVHICLGTSDVFNDSGSGAHRARQETFCNMLAAEILVPEKLFLTAWESLHAPSSHSEIVWELAENKFHCGATTVARRALDAQLLSQNEYEAIVQRTIELAREEKAKRREELAKKDKTGFTTIPHRANQLSKRFVRMVANSVNNGTTTYTEAFDLTETNYGSFGKLVEAAGGEIK